VTDQPKPTTKEIDMTVSNKDDRDDYGAALAGYRHDPDVVRAQQRLNAARAKISDRAAFKEQAKYRRATGGR
jgi:hypothetical protein